MSTDLTPEELAMTPAGKPPPGVIPNLVNPGTQDHALLVVGSILMFFMLLLASMRFFTKLYIVRKTTWDDWTCAVAIFGTILYYIICCYAVIVGKYGTHIWDMSVAHVLSKEFLIPSFLVNFVSAIVWLFVKLSFFILYFQLFRPMIWLRYCIYFGAFVNVAFYVAIVIATLYYTAPAPGQSWQANSRDPREAGAIKMTIPIASGSLVLDVYIFLLPIAGIWNLKLSLQRKLGVMVVFLTGLMACIASSLSIYYKNLLDHDAVDYTRSVLPVITMALVEMCVGISASCMPALTNMIRHGTTWTALRSRLSGTFAAIRSSKLRSKKSHSSSQPKDTFGAIDPYTNMDMAGSNELAMGHSKSIRTFISSGQPNEANDDDDDDDDDGIHLSYAFSQELSDPRSRDKSPV